MAIKYWVGGTSDNMSTAANFSPAAVLEAGDALILRGSPTYSPATNVQQDIDLAGVYVWDDYAGGLAAVGTPFKFGAAEVIIASEQNTPIYMMGYSDAKRLDVIHINNTNNAGTVYLSGAFLGACYFNKGRIDIATASSILTSLTIGYITNPQGDVVLTINDSTGSATTITGTVECSGGSVDNFAAIDTLNHMNGTWRHGDGDMSLCGYLKNLNERGGILKWNAGTLGHTGAAAGVVNLYSGVIDASGGPGARTIDNCTVSGGSLNLDNHINNITLTNAITVNAGVPITVSPGTVISLA